MLSFALQTNDNIQPFFEYSSQPNLHDLFKKIINKTYHRTVRCVSMMSHGHVSHSDTSAGVTHILVFVWYLHRVGWQRFSVFYPNFGCFDPLFAVLKRDQAQSGRAVQRKRGYVITKDNRHLQSRFTINEKLSNDNKHSSSLALQSSTV